MRKSLIAIGLMGLSTVALAHHIPKVTKKDKKGRTCLQVKSHKHWTGQIQFGYVSNTGNTDTENYSGGMDFEYRPSNWAFLGDFSTQLSMTKDTRTAEEYNEAGQARYYLKSDNFWFGNIKATQNPFGTYDRTMLAAAGFGWQVFRLCHQYLTWQIGPGWRNERVAGSEKFENDPVIYTQANYVWAITDKTKFTEALQADAGEKNTYAQSVTAITTKLIGHLALSVSYTAKYNTRIPSSSTHKHRFNSTTNLSVIYNF